MTVPNSAIQSAKHAIRQRVWDLLQARSAVRDPDVHGRIPDFIGSAQAAEQLASMPAWNAAQVIKAVPDKAQLPVRARALSEGKLVYMAVPKLADLRPFYLLDPARLTRPPDEAASSHVAATDAPKVSISQLRPIDLVVCGSVAVNRRGHRIGKGAGYSDLEVALLHDAGLLGSHTIIATTVHPLQVLDEPLPTADHDFEVDLIATPDEVILCRPSRGRAGILWNHLPAEYIDTIPILGSLLPRAPHAKAEQHSASS
jgi:5-formyltetrahydrofolate cyclo-ligase